MNAINQDLYRTASVIFRVLDDDSDEGTVFTAPLPKLAAEVERRIGSCNLPVSDDGVVTVHLVDCTIDELEYWRPQVYRSSNIYSTAQLGLEIDHVLAAGGVIVDVVRHRARPEVGIKDPCWHYLYRGRAIPFYQD
jgi:hypothetical protein